MQVRRREKDAGNNKAKEDAPGKAVRNTRY
jgi:hypothetical protein